MDEKITVTLDLVDAMEASLLLERYSNLLVIMDAFGDNHIQRDVNPEDVASLAGRIDKAIKPLLRKGV